MTIQASSDQVSVVLSCNALHRWDQLQRTVDSLRRQSVPPTEIILVVEDSEPLEQRAQRTLPEVTVIWHRRQPGHNALVAGAVRATGDIVAFLEADSLAPSTWVEQLRAVYGNPEIAGVTGPVVAMWPDRRPAWFPHELDWVAGCSVGTTPLTPEELATQRPINASFRRSALQADDLWPHHLIFDPDIRLFRTVTADQIRWGQIRSRCFDTGRSWAVSPGKRARSSIVRHYLGRTVPGGVGRALRDSVANPARLLSVFTILAGMMVAASGYLVAPRHRRMRALESGRQRLALAVGTEGAPALIPASLDPAVRGGPLPARHLRLHAAGLAAGLLLWALSLRGVDLRAMNDLGLLAVLPVTFWASLAVLTVNFCLLLRGPSSPRWLLAGHVVALIAVLHATPALLYDTLRYSWSWKHIGVVEYLLGNGSIDLNAGADNGLNAYQGWPGFFALNAVVTEGSGLRSSLGYAAWAPPVFNLLWLGPMMVIFRTFTDDRRHVWLGLWIFFLASWVGQDYFSPQAVALFFYLAIVAMCLRWLPDVRSVSVGRGGTMVALPRVDVPAPAQLMVILVVMVGAIVSSHQLTPFMLISALAVLWLTRARRVGVVLAVAVVTTVVWIATIGRVFIDQNLAYILESLGSGSSNANDNLVNLTGASPGQILVARADRLLTVAVWALGALGVWRRRGRFRKDLPVLLLAFSPLPLVVSNSYGGEIVFRVYQFSLPFVAFFAAASFFPSVARGRSRAAFVSSVVVLSLLLGGFALAYYGKEQSNYFTPEEVAAATWLHRSAPPDSLVVAPTSSLPYAFENFENLEFAWFAQDNPEILQLVRRDPVGGLTDMISRFDHPTAYLMFSRAQAAGADMTGLLPIEDYRRIEESVARSDRFERVYGNRDSVIYRLQPGVPAPPGREKPTAGALGETGS